MEYIKERKLIDPLNPYFQKFKYHPEYEKEVKNNKRTSYLYFIEELNEWVSSNGRFVKKLKSIGLDPETYYVRNLVPRDSNNIPLVPRCKYCNSVLPWYGISKRYKSTFCNSRCSNLYLWDKNNKDGLKFRERHSDALVRNWSKENSPYRTDEFKLKCSKRRPTSKPANELFSKLKDFLINNNISSEEYIYTIDNEFGVQTSHLSDRVDINPLEIPGRFYFLDFYDRKSNRAIEFFGDYWHSTKYYYKNSLMKNDEDGLIGEYCNSKNEDDSFRLFMVKIALSMREDILVIEEHDYNNDPVGILTKCINYIKRGDNKASYNYLKFEEDVLMMDPEEFNYKFMKNDSQ